MKNIEWRHVTWYSQLFAIILFLDVFGLGFWLGLQVEASKVETAMLGDQSPATHQEAHTTATAPGGIISSASYACTGGKTIQAIYKQNSVELNLSDGRSMNLLQGLSADGGRYTNSDESFVFWSKGNTAFITEGKNTTYKDCTVKPQTP